MVRSIYIHFALLLCFCLALVFSQVLPCVSEESISNLGVFDATADWCIEPQFGPKRSVYKIPGYVEV